MARTAKKQKSTPQYKNAWHMLVDITRMSNLENGLVTPRIFKTKSSRQCKSITVIDVNKVQYTVSVEDYGNSKVKLFNANWVRFVQKWIDEQTEKLYFNLIADDTFQVICFDSCDMHTKVHANGVETIERCLVKSCNLTVDGEYLPGPFLEDLDDRTKFKPNTTVKVYGMKQNADVQVIYESEDESDSDESDNDEEQEVKIEEGEEVEKPKRVYWNAVGFTGSTWTNFCIVNNILPGNIIMFTNPHDKTYLVDVFTAEGVGLGVAASKDNQVLSEYDSDDDSDEKDVKVGKHKCRVIHHQHKPGRASFSKRFTYHTLGNRELTTPKPIVRAYDVDTYSKVQISFGDFKFPASLKVKADKRPGRDQKHLVLIADWESFLAKTGLVVGNRLWFHLKVKKTADGEVLAFHVC